MKTGSSMGLIVALVLAPLAVGDVVSDLVLKAEKGEAAAQMELAGIYFKGEGVAKDAGQGLKWLTLAAEQGNGEAQMKLGGIHLAGKGVRKSSSEAAKWYLMGAEQGNAAAQCQVARMCMTGAGVVKDDVEAYKWANLAAAQGESAAKKVLVFLEQRMSPAQMAEGQTRSRDFLEMKQAEKTMDLPPEVPVEPAPPVAEPE